MAGHLTLVCHKCTREQSFLGINATDAAGKAKAAGWISESLSRYGVEGFVCPTCPGVREPSPELLKRSA